jgi:hypothetical protein
MSALMTVLLGYCVPLAPLVSSHPGLLQRKFQPSVLAVPLNEVFVYRCSVLPSGLVERLALPLDQEFHVLVFLARVMLTI